MIYRSLEEMIVDTAEMVRPPERLSVPEAAEKYRWLNNPGSYVGPWDNDMAPYLVEPMEVLTSLNYTGMIFVGPARTGKSDMFFNWVTHTVKCDPADMLLIHMTRSTARDWSKGDFGKFTRHTKTVGEQLAGGRQNDNVFDKFFRSAMRILVKWPAISELSGKTVPRGWLMDYDRMPQDVEKEGTPFDLARKRTESYRRHGMTAAESSPGFPIKDPRWIASTPHEAPPAEGILSLYNRGDRRRWYWRCVSCLHAFEPTFALLQWAESKDIVESAESAVLVCPHCGQVYHHEGDRKMGTPSKYELNRNGRWVKDGMIWMPDGRIVGTPRRSDIASFWMKGPAAIFQTWKGLVLNYLQAEEEYRRTGEEKSLTTHYNVDRGEPYLPKAMGETRLPEDLKARAQDWGGDEDNPVVPDGVRFLIVTVDVQKRSFVVHVHGIGVGGDVWIVDMFKLRKSERVDQDGDVLQLDPSAYLEDWKVLIEATLERTYPLADGSGRHMAVKLVGCDSGGRAGVTTKAYEFWRFLRDDDEPKAKGHAKRFQLLKGEPKPRAPRFQLSYPDASRKDRHSGARGDVPVAFLHSDTLKDQVHGMLGRTDPGDGKAGGMVNFPVWAPNWLYTQLTSEVRTDKGWENTAGNRRNEAFDLLYYAVGLYLHPSIRLPNIDWDQPPAWAAPWDTNALVFDPEGNFPFSPHANRDYKLGDLAEKLA